MKFLGLLLFSGAVVIFEVPRLWRNKMWREMIVFAGLMLIAMTMSFAEILHIDQPNPTDFVDMVFNPLSDAVLSLLK